MNENGPKMILATAYDLRKKIIEPILKSLGKIKKEHHNYTVERRSLEESVEYIYSTLVKEMMENKSKMNTIVKFTDEIKTVHDVKVDTKISYNPSKIKVLIKEIVGKTNIYEAGTRGNVSKFAIDRFKFGKNINQNEKLDFGKDKSQTYENIQSKKRRVWEEELEEREEDKEKRLKELLEQEEKNKKD